MVADAVNIDCHLIELTATGILRELQKSFLIRIREQNLLLKMIF